MELLWLVGMMGAGKSVVGRRVAERLGVDFVDLDAEITARLGCSIAQFWGERGEAAFRDLEAAQVARVAAREQPAVVATGGGVVLDDGSVGAMRGSGTVVWLDAPASVLVTRVGRGADRPLLAGDAGLAVERLATERAGAYRAAAHHRVDTGSLSVDDVAAEVAGLWPAT